MQTEETRLGHFQKSFENIKMENGMFFQENVNRKRRIFLKTLNVSDYSKFIVVFIEQYLEFDTLICIFLPISIRLFKSKA